MADNFPIGPRTRVSLTGEEVPDTRPDAPKAAAPATVKLGRTFSRAENLGIALSYEAYGAMGAWVSLAMDPNSARRLPSAELLRQSIGNWRNDTELSPHNIFHATVVGIPTYWSARKLYADHGVDGWKGVAVATALTGLTAVSAEIMQGAMGDQPDKGDVRRSVAFGFVGGEAAFQLGNYAQTQRGPIWHALGHLGKTKVGDEGSLRLIPKNGGAEIKYQRSIP
jgi:hypothetical protein